MFKILVFYIILIHQLTKLKVLVYKTAFYLAVEKENIEIVKLLLSNDALDVNTRYILCCVFLYYYKFHFSQN